MITDCEVGLGFADETGIALAPVDATLPEELDFEVVCCLEVVDSNTITIGGVLEEDIEGFCVAGLELLVAAFDGEAEVIVFVDVAVKVEITAEVEELIEFEGVTGGSVFSVDKPSFKNPLLSITDL